MEKKTGGGESGTGGRGRTFNSNLFSGRKKAKGAFHTQVRGTTMQREQENGGVRKDDPVVSQGMRATRGKRSRSDSHAK